MNETLEAQAQALFQRIMDEGGDCVPFADIVEILGGGTPKTSVAGYWNGEIPWFSVADAPRESDVFVIDTEKKITQAGVESSSTQVLPVGTTIISARGTVGKIALVGVPMAINQSCYGLRGKFGKHGYYTYFATRALVATLQQHAHGSVFDTITRDTLVRVEMAIPETSAVEDFEGKVSPLMERIRNNLFESRTLAALRDALLPKLLSGEVRVSAMEDTSRS
jgi:type I restriction enzyme S subunit